MAAIGPNGFCKFEFCLGHVRRAATYQANTLEQD